MPCKISVPPGRHQKEITLTASNLQDIYKKGTKSKQTQDQHEARIELLRKITDETLLKTYGLTIKAPSTLADDPGADHLDALLCAIQAAWAWNHRNEHFGAPNPIDPLEGWIADPSLRNP